MMTDQPCLQLFSGANQRPGPRPLAGQNHIPYSGLCLEPQQYVNAVSINAFPATLISPDQPYRQTTQVRITPEFVS